MRLGGMIGRDRVLSNSELHLAPQTAVPTALARLCRKPRDEITLLRGLSFQSESLQVVRECFLQGVVRYGKYC